MVRIRGVLSGVYAGVFFFKMLLLNLVLGFPFNSLKAQLLAGGSADSTGDRATERLLVVAVVPDYCGWTKSVRTTQE